MIWSTIFYRILQILLKKRKVVHIFNNEFKILFIKAMGQNNPILLSAEILRSSVVPKNCGSELFLECQKRDDLSLKINDLRFLDDSQK